MADYRVYAVVDAKVGDSLGSVLAQWVSSQEKAKRAMQMWAFKELGLRYGAECTIEVKGSPHPLFGLEGQDLAQTLLQRADSIFGANLLYIPYGVEGTLEERAAVVAGFPIAREKENGDIEFLRGTESVFSANPSDTLPEELPPEPEPEEEMAEDGTAESDAPKGDTAETEPAQPAQP